MRRATTIPAVAAAIAVAIVFGTALSGCSEISDAVHNESSESFTSTKDLDGNWGREASWLPGDARHILVHESTTTASAPAILAATTTSPLNPATCTETTRLSGPDFAQTWAPKNVYVKNAWVCGDWDVIPTSKGWFGWTPNSPKERAATLEK